MKADMAAEQLDVGALARRAGLCDGPSVRHVPRRAPPMLGR
jgi:hypothetical protein